ncbi:UPF0641 membrane protein [Colletotrichum spaethianum]|uniref:UPF0641 membrane protein n=1 Tax=Colletotrichum spaethianum TaxID=700344 RepID=A0AA37P535_9PEZI|nr:UPF0641 membrane protein [Colletotrichum spaethianum]GKT42786.1 UPF0641 membrane protein [Colletotrichum spaethianum]
MFSKTTVAITSLLALAQAVKVTKPAKGDDWDISATNEITWETVSSDPKSFEIVIVNQSGYPGVSETIAKVNAADGKYELKDPKVAAGDGYRINLVSTDPQNSGILAQSEQFTLTGDSDDTSSSASASATASASASGSASASASATGSSSGSATVTQTASGLTTVTGSATSTASGTAASNASGSGTASGTATGTATGTAASGTSTTAPNSASAIKSTFAIFGSVAVAAYMLF